MEDNRLIAEFMGVGPVKGSDGYFSYGDGVFFTVREKTYEKAMEAVVGYVKYRTSWDWLMPVVVKMCELKHHEDRNGELVEFQASWSGYPHVTIREKSSNAIYNSYTHYNQFGISHWDVPLHDQIYSGVVEFIKWYNKNKKA
jgi:hypothetical protein